MRYMCTAKVHIFFQQMWCRAPPLSLIVMGVPVGTSGKFGWFYVEKKTWHTLSSWDEEKLFIEIRPKHVLEVKVDMFGSHLIFFPWLSQPFFFSGSFQSEVPPIHQRWTFPSWETLRCYSAMSTPRRTSSTRYGQGDIETWEGWSPN